MDKALALIGEGRSTTIVDGYGIGTVVYISSSNVVFCNFTVQNSGSSGGSADSGIRLQDSFNSSVISNNAIHNGWFGINFYNNGTNCIARDNFVANNVVGIFFYQSGWNEARNNVAKNNSYVGISVSSSPDCKLENNLIENNAKGLSVYYSSGTIINHNNIVNNTFQVEAAYTLSIWNSTNEGNYWSDYAGVDSDHDGIGDSWHEIDENNRPPSFDGHVFQFQHLDR